MANKLFRKKSIQELLQNSSQGNTLVKELSTFDLTMLGIGAIIGTGIFVLTGAGALTAGPALTLSFIIAGLACFFAALYDNSYVSYVIWTNTRYVCDVKRWFNASIFL